MSKIQIEMKENGAGQYNLAKAMHYIGYPMESKRKFLENYVYGNAPEIPSTSIARERWFWKKDLDEFIKSKTTMSRKQLRNKVGVRS